MIYNPDIHNRRSLRLRNWNYASPGWYFVTICTHNRELFFQDIPELGNIVELQWLKIPERFPGVRLNDYAIMPNHFHGLLWVGAGLAPAHNSVNPTPTLGKIIGSYKSCCTYEWRKCLDGNDLQMTIKFWQRGYHDRIVRNRKELMQIRQYIKSNPGSWETDEENPNSSILL